MMLPFFPQRLHLVRNSLLFVWIVGVNKKVLKRWNRHHAVIVPTLSQIGNAVAYRKRYRG